MPYLCIVKHVFEFGLKLRDKMSLEDHYSEREKISTISFYSGGREENLYKSFQIHLELKTTS